MKFNLIKTRRGRLQDYLENRFVNRLEPEDIRIIMAIVDEYEKDNLESIEKLKRTRTVDVNKINGALKQAINAHGPITKVLIGSATKRIMGAMLDNKPEPKFWGKVKEWIKKKWKH